MVDLTKKRNVKNYPERALSSTDSAIVYDPGAASVVVTGWAVGVMGS